LENVVGLHRYNAASYFRVSTSYECWLVCHEYGVYVKLVTMDLAGQCV